MKKITSLLLTAVLLATMSLCTTLSVFAAGAVPYKDKTWDEQKNAVVTTEATADTTAVTANMGTWGAAGSETWYAVSGAVTLSVRPEVLGDVRLILCDNAILTAPKGITLEEGNSLTVYAQSEGDARGAIVVNGNGSNAAYGNGSNAAYGNGSNAAIGGRGGSYGGCDAYGSGERGGVGSSGGVLCWKGGSLSVTASNGVCIGGGSGGNGGNADKPHANAGDGGDGGNGVDVSVYGGVLSLDGAFGISGGSGGSGGCSLDYGGGFGGNGGSSGTFTVYNGNVTIYSTEGACIGGKGGNGGDSAASGSGRNGGSGGNGSGFTVYNGTVELHSTNGICIGGGKGGNGGAANGGDASPGGCGNGGNGGNGGNIHISGGTVVLQTAEASSCIGGGAGGPGGISEDMRKYGCSGQPGADATLVIEKTLFMKAGDDARSAVATDSYDGQKYLLVSPSNESLTNPINTGSVLSEGNIWIIFAVAVAVFAIGGVVALVIVKKKKKPALAGDAENTDEE